MSAVAEQHQPTTQHWGAMLSADNATIDGRLREGAADHELLRSQVRFSEMVSASGLHFEGRSYPVSLRPLVLDPAVERTVIAVAERLVSVLDTAAVLYCKDEQVRNCFPCYHSVTRFIRSMPTLAPLVRICRFDGLFDTRGQYRIVETNTEGPGGVIQAGLAARIWAQAENPLTPGLALNVYKQPFVANPDCFLHELLSTHRKLTAHYPSRAAVVNFRGRYTNEVDWIARGLNNLGVDATILDAGALRRKSGRLVDPGGLPLDLVYNKLDVRDLIDEPAVEEYLTSTANQEATCINPWVAQWILTDKAILAILSDDRFASNFTPPERELLKAHVPWTRFVEDVSTTDMEGRRVNLLSYAIAKREGLVLKPSNATRGEGVKIGRVTDPNEWAETLSHAVGAQNYVLQEYIAAPRLNALNPDDGTIESMAFGLDAFVFGGRFAGFHARASIDPVLNVGKRGILIPVAVASPSSPGLVPRDHPTDAPLREVVGT
jgi:glutathionylspermidine synthase